MKNLLVSALFITIGLAAFYGANYKYSKTKLLDKVGIESEGTIVGFEESRNDDDELMFAPIYEFYDQNNTKRQYTHVVKSAIKGPVTGRKPTQEIGDKAKLIYNPEDIDQIMIDSFFGRYGLTLILSLLGLIFFIVGFVFYLKRG